VRAAVVGASERGFARVYTRRSLRSVVTRNVRGRPLLLGVGALVVCLAAVVGFVIGSKAAETGTAFRIAGTVVLPLSGPAMAGYAVGVALVVLGGLFAAVETASRRER
jgi:hypothetical protein